MGSHLSIDDLRLCRAIVACSIHQVILEVLLFLVFTSSITRVHRDLFKIDVHISIIKIRQDYLYARILHNMSLWIRPIPNLKLNLVLARFQDSTDEYRR